MTSDIEKDTEMTHRERVHAALRGDSVDRPPVSLWRHFPKEDETVDGLVAATVRFQREYDFDFVKQMPTGMYGVIDYGVTVQISDDDIGTTRFVSGPILESTDWERLPALRPDTGILGSQVEVVRRVRHELGPDTPIIQTIFSPLMLAAKLAGGTEPLKLALTESEAAVIAGLDRLTQDTIAFGQCCLGAGADGFFFATQLATPSEMTRDGYEKFGAPFDLRVLEALRERAWFTMLHLHGEDPYFELADRYPVDAVNWHDRETAPSLSEALKLTGKTLVGGLERRGALTTGTPEAVWAEVQDAIDQTNGRRYIVAPGCVVPFTAPAENLKAARRSVKHGEQRSQFPI